jgi:putative transposase
VLLRKAYRFRIYPDAEQEVLFRRTIGCCRLVYNLCLALQLPFLKISESMGNHDSKIVDADSVD